MAYLITSYTSYNSSYPLYKTTNTNWKGQTFKTDANAVEITSVQVPLTGNLLDGESAGNVEVRIYATSSGLPTGTPLGSKVVNVYSNLHSSTPYWFEFTFSSAIAITANTTYAIVAFHPGFVDFDDDVWWQYDSSSPSYADGSEVYSANTGSSWSAYTGVDLAFRVYGNIASAGTNTQINIGDTWKDVSAMKINIGDTWKDVTAVKQNIGDVWKTVF